MEFMKKLSTFLAILVSLTAGRAFAGEIIEKGIYQGKNLYVQNPFTSNMENFCTEKVFVNDVLVLNAPNSSAFEISLEHLKLKAAVTVKIVYSDDCKNGKPKILNLQAIKTESKFQFASFNIDEDGIHWSTKGEREKGTFFIQHFVNNTWVTVKKVEGKKVVAVSYDIDSEHHSGLNKYRVRYLENGGQSFYSKTIEFESSKSPVEIYPRKVTDKLYFKPSTSTKYVIYDKFGNVILEGKGKEIDCTGLKPHEHYTIEFDNQTKEFLKKDKNSY